MTLRSKKTLAALALLAAAAWLGVRVLRPLEVQAVPVIRGKAVDAAYATGSVEAATRVEVRARVGGTVAELAAREGAVVRAGDRLARIDNPEVLADLERGRAELSAARAESGPAGPKLAALRAQGRALDSDLAEAERDLARAERLFAEGTLAEAQRDEARRLASRLRQELAANREQLRSLEIDVAGSAGATEAQVRGLASRLDYGEVRAPMDGVVLARYVELGQVVAPNEPLFKVGDGSDLIVEVWVDEADIGKVRAGSGDGAEGSAVAVSLYSFADRVFRGRVFEIYPDANRERKAYLAKVRLEDPPAGLRSGMTAEVNIIAREKSGALLAPIEAVPDGFAWALRDGRARRSPVQVGVRDLRYAEILSGLSEGDLVIVSGLDKLADGRRVRPAESKTPPDGAAPHGVAPHGVAPP